MNSKRITCTEARVSHETYSGSTLSKSQKTWRERQNIILFNIFFQIKSPIRTMWSGALRWSCGRWCSESFAALVHCVVTEARVSHKTYSGSTFSKSQKTWRERQNIILSNIFFFRFNRQFAQCGVVCFVVRAAVEVVKVSRLLFIAHTDWSQNNKWQKCRGINLNYFRLKWTEL